jgi:NAD(P)-dependent dehydrogenase (short-subunit alcohol dehydrogenase family)
MNTLEGKTAWVTGGSSGIGLETARLFLANGARVAITGRDTKKLEAAARELGAGVLTVRADAGSVSETEAAVQQIVERFGQLDIVFANAGFVARTALGSTTLETFEEILRTNVTGVYFTVQAAAPHLRDGGSVVLNGSVHAVLGAPATAAYAASKAAVRSLARSLATELALRKIRVNTVVPGATRTPIWDASGPTAEAMTALEARMARSMPLGRMVEPQEIAQAVLFLASDASAMITGSEIVVDGGMTQSPFGAPIYR